MTDRLSFLVTPTSCATNCGLLSPCAKCQCVNVEKHGRVHKAVPVGRHRKPTLCCGVSGCNRYVETSVIKPSPKLSTASGY